MKTPSQIYNTIIIDIALGRKGIKATSIDTLTKKDWKVLIANAKGDEELAYIAVEGYFNQEGSEGVEEYIG